MNKKSLLNEPLVDPRFLEDVRFQRKRPRWVLKEPLACIGAWEPLFHRRRLGTTWVDDEKLYEAEHSETFVRQVRSTGCRILVTAFHKNHHIDPEEFDLKRKLLRLCHKHRLRLSTYIRASEIYSEVFAEQLKKEDLLAIKADGRPSGYGFGEQEWRKGLCYHKPRNVELFKEAIRRSVSDLGADMLNIDGFDTGGCETYDACRCEACRRDFTAFLVRRYGDDPKICKRRFGHTCIESIEPPGLMSRPSMPMGRVTNPVWQEWIRFRCTWSARIARIISQHVYELNPEVAILVNSSLAVRENAALLVGYDLAAIGPYVDIMAEESAYEPRIMADGKILQRVRQHSMTRTAGTWLWNYMIKGCDTARKQQQQLGHAAAFNRGRVTCMGFVFSCYSGDMDFRRNLAVKQHYLHWLDQHWNHYQGLESVADVVVWREPKAMAFADPLAYATAMQMEQLLVEDRIPFDIGFGWPVRAPVIVLPGLSLLDSAECERMICFVKGGGGLMVIGPTSILDGWGRRRLDFGLRSILPREVQLPEVMGTGHVACAGAPMGQALSVVKNPDRILYHRAGRGRMVFVEELVDPSTQPSLFNVDHTYNFSLDTTNWRIPKNADAIRRALAWLADNRTAMRVEAERGVIAQHYRQPSHGWFYSHLVNLKDQPVGNVVLRMELPKRVRVLDVRVFSPDGKAVEKADWRCPLEQLSISLEKLDVYSMVQIQTKLNRLRRSYLPH